jgi:hypothetical protein
MTPPRCSAPPSPAILDRRDCVGLGIAETLEQYERRQNVVRGRGPGAVGSPSVSVSRRDVGCAQAPATRSAAAWRAPGASAKRVGPVPLCDERVERRPRGAGPTDAGASSVLRQAVTLDGLAKGFLELGICSRAAALRSDSGTATRDPPSADLAQAHYRLARPTSAPAESAGGTGARGLRLTAAPLG